MARIMVFCIIEESIIFYYRVKVLEIIIPCTYKLTFFIKDKNQLPLVVIKKWIANKNQSQPTIF